MKGQNEFRISIDPLRKQFRGNLKETAQTVDEFVRLRSSCHFQCGRVWAILCPEPASIRPAASEGVGRLGDSARTF